MPNEPMTEPTLEELSAFLDYELDVASESRVAEHIAGCADCQARLDGLRQTAHAIRALPMETPARRFTVPAAPARQGWRWAPAGWIGGVAVAMLVVVIGVTHLNFGPAASPTAGTSNGAASLSAPYAAARNAAPGAGAAAPADKTLTVASRAQAFSPFQPSRSIVIASDARNYTLRSTMTVEIDYIGFNPAQVPPAELFLERNGYAVQLSAPTHATAQPGGIEGQYNLATLPLPQQPDGVYTMTVIQELPADAGPGATLVAHLTITISG